MQIEISFGLWKRLLNLLEDENDSYDAVIARLLDAAPPDRLAPPPRPDDSSTPAANRSNGAYFKDTFLPNGTQMRATYKGRTYYARISDSEWVDETTGDRRSSPSQAAYYITGNNVNGWLFWLAKRPTDNDWHSLNALRAGYLR